MLLIITNECLEKRFTEAENYYKGVKLTLNISYLIIHLNLSLKIDERVTWDWATVFWPFWILSALYFGAIFMSAIGLIWKICPVLFTCHADWPQTRAVLWFVMNIEGVAFFSIFFFYNLEQSLNDGHIYNSFITVFMLGGIYSGLLVGYSFMIKKDILKMFWEIREQYLRELDEENGVVSGRSRRQRTNQVVPRKKKDKPKRKVKKLEIPKYLVKLGGAFFGRATAKDIFYQKMDKQKFKIEKKKKMKSLTVKPKIGVVFKDKKGKGREDLEEDIVIMMGSHRSRNDGTFQTLGETKRNETKEVPMFLPKLKIILFFLNFF